jgi:hypothetical protein
MRAADPLGQQQFAADLYSKVHRKLQLPTSRLLFSMLSMETTDPCFITAIEVLRSRLVKGRTLSICSIDLLLGNQR